MFVLQMLFVSLRIRHRGPADRAGKLEPSSCSPGVIVLVVSCLFLFLLPLPETVELEVHEPFFVFRRFVLVLYN